MYAHKTFSHAFCSFLQAPFQCSGNWQRRRGSRSCTPLSFRVSSTAASGWWRELWPKRATSSLTTAAGTWRTKRGEQREGERGAGGVREEGVCVWISDHLWVFTCVPQTVKCAKTASCQPCPSKGLGASFQNTRLPADVTLWGLKTPVDWHKNIVLPSEESPPNRG